MEIRKIAESIVKGLNNFENKSSAIDKISHSYTDYQIEIVLEHLRHLTSVSPNTKGWICDNCKCYNPPGSIVACRRCKAKRR